MNLTIYTDASLKDNECGWAFWSRTSNRWLKGGGYKSIDVTFDSMTGEMYAMYIALKTCLQYYEGVTRVYMVGDSLNAIQALEKTVYKGKKMKFYRNHIVKAFVELKERYGVQVEFRKVKAHQGNATSRTSINEWCDSNANYARKSKSNFLI